MPIPFRGVRGFFPPFPGRTLSLRTGERGGVRRGRYRAGGAPPAGGGPAGKFHIVGSHDFSLDVLRDMIKTRYPAMDLISAHVGSLSGILAMQKGIVGYGYDSHPRRAGKGV